MRIGMTSGGDVLARPSTPAEVVAEARRAEEEGFASAWSVHFSRAYDALTTLAVAGSVTSRIELGVGIVPTYPRHPLALAQQAATAQVSPVGELAVVGTEADVEKQLRRYADVGVTDLWPAVFPAGDPRTHALLAGL